MRFLRTLTLKTDVITGAQIDDVASDICELANRTGVTVISSFNGHKIDAAPKMKPNDIIKQIKPESATD